MYIYIYIFTYIYVNSHPHIYTYVYNKNHVIIFKWKEATNVVGDMGGLQEKKLGGNGGRKRGGSDVILFQ